MLLEPVALKVGVVPMTGLLFTSSKVIVTVDEATLLAVTGPVAAIVEVEALAASAMKVTVPETPVRGEVRLTVLSSAFVEVKEQKATPLVLVELQVILLLFEPLTEISGVILDTPLL